MYFLRVLRLGIGNDEDQTDTLLSSALYTWRKFVFLSPWTVLWKEGLCLGCCLARLVLISELSIRVLSVLPQRVIESVFLPNLAGTCCTDQRLCDCSLHHFGTAETSRAIYLFDVDIHRQLNETFLAV